MVEAPLAVLNERDKKLALQKICWNIRNAARKRAKLKRRLNKINGDLRDNELLMSDLCSAQKQVMDELKAGGWDAAQMAIFESRTGLKLPD